MKRNNLLLPYACKSAGWVLLGIGVILTILWLTIDFDFSINDIRELLGLSPIDIPADKPVLICFTADTQLMNRTLSVLFILGGFLAGFSRCRVEDEFTEYIRYRALTITMFILLAVALITELFFWGLKALIISALLHMFFPIFYVLYLHITLYIERKRNEE